MNAIVLDAGAFFRLDTNWISTILNNQTSIQIYTIPQVLSEVKDKSTKDSLFFQLLFPLLKIKMPSDSSYRKVLDFSKKTGDFSVLSMNDLKVIALTLDLQLEFGSDCFVPRDSCFTVLNNTDIGKSLDDKNASDDTTSCHILQNNKQDSKTIDDDDNDGWITPKNIKSKLAAHLSGDTNSNQNNMLNSNEGVCCITTDYAMQNVLLQMGLNLKSVNGLQIKQLKSFILRCHACYHTTNEMSKKFCPKCGGNTLTRVSITVDSNTGNTILHLKKNFNFRLRGTIYSLPNPKGGRSNDIVLREDQKEYVRGVYRQKIEQKKKESLLDSNLGGVYEFGDRFNLSRKASHNQGTIVVGHGRKNPNQVKRK